MKTHGVFGIRWHLLVVVLALGLPCACGPANAPAVVANPVRQSLAEQVLLARKLPLQLRFNPAQCPCPPFEIRVGQRWWRVELSANDNDALANWLEFLGQSAAETLPIAVQIDGVLEREIVRTPAGAYALKVDVAKIVEPLPPPPPPVVAPPLPADPQPAAP
ncbi:MAG: hypothetical protein EXR77_17790 [Myxococcales bacterium]|nr:hypothetical protein [Myxococcales bacterium]